MKRLPFLIIALVLSTIYCTGAIITGTLKDAQGVPVPGATVKLLAIPDSTLAGAESTTGEGRYKLQGVAPGRYWVAAEMFGMSASPYAVKILNENDSLAVPDIVLKDESKALKEVVVSATKTAIKAGQDTIEYNAGSFKTKQNAVVEDLLKKLPGVEVSSDGSIKSGGKTVTKILVDGEEFFSDDPKMASKNIPSEIVDKVQVLERKSDAARLTGVDDGEEETVINLKIKKGMKNGWFGDVEAGYGTDGRYKAGFNVNMFRDANQITFLGSANNVNDMAFTDMGRGRFRDFGGDGGITTSQSLGVNFSVGNSEKLRVGGNVLYTHNSRDYTKSAEMQYLFPDSVSYQNSLTKSLDKGHNVRADFRLQWQIDENNTIDFRPRLSFNSRRSEKNDTSSLRAGDADLTLVNTQKNVQDNKGNSWETSGDLIYSHKVASHPGRQLSARLRYNYSDTREHGFSRSRIMYYLLSGEDENLNRYLDNHSWSNSVETRLTWTEPIGDSKKGHFLNFAYNLKYSFNNADKYTYDVQPDDELIADESLSNRFRNDFFTQEIQVGYKGVQKMYNLEAGALLTPSMSRSEDLLNAQRNIPTRWVWNVAPYMRFRYKFSKTKSLSMDYRARTSQPSMKQLQPVADESDPLHITVGNPDLKPTFTQTLMMRFADFSAESQRSLMAMGHVSWALNSIVARTMSNAETGGQTTTYANVNNALNVMAMGMFSQPLAKAHWRMSAQMFLSYSNNPGYINGDLNRSSNLMISPKVGVTYSCDVFQMSVNPQYSLQSTHNTLPLQPGRTVHSYGFNADANLYLPFGLELSTDLDFSKTSGYAEGYNSSQWLWNAQLSYSFLKSKSLTLSVDVYDILQMKRSISRNVTATYISDEAVNALTRYAMVTLSYKFRTFGSGKQVEELMPGEFGPPPHDGPPPEGPPPGGHPGPPPGGGHGGPPPF